MLLNPRNAPDEPVLSAMVACLGESPAAARRLVRAWQQERTRIRASWERSAADTASAALARAAEVCIPDHQAFRTYLQYHDCGTILLGLHQGDYINGLLALLAGSPPCQVMILRRKQATPVEAAFLQLAAAGHQVRVVRHGPAAVRELVRGLRRGAIAILMFDLSARWGATHPVQFLGLPMNWALGPFTLAVLGRAVVIPWVSVTADGTDTLELLPAMDCRLGGSPAVLQQDACDRLTPSIRRHPAQWHHWHLVAEALQP